MLWINKFVKLDIALKNCSNQSEWLNDSEKNHATNAQTQCNNYFEY